MVSEAPFQPKPSWDSAILFPSNSPSLHDKVPSQQSPCPLPHTRSLPEGSSQEKAPHQQQLHRARFIRKDWGKCPLESRYQLEKGLAVTGTIGGGGRHMMPPPSCCSLKIKRRAQGVRLFRWTSQHHQMLLPMRIRHHLGLGWSQLSPVCGPSAGRSAERCWEGDRGWGRAHNGQRWGHPLLRATSTQPAMAAVLNTKGHPRMRPGPPAPGPWTLNPQSLCTEGWDESPPSAWRSAGI